MATKRKATKKKPKAPPPPPPGSPVVRSVLLLVAIVFIVLVTGYLFAGTEGFRSIVESRIEAALGIPLEIESSRALLHGGLVFEDVHTTNRIADGVGGVQVDRASIRIGWLALLGGDLAGATRAVEVQGWRVHFAPDAEGVMQPRALSGASDWLGQWGGLALPDSREISTKHRAGRAGAPEVSMDASGTGQALDAWTNTQFSLRGGDIAWWDRHGNEVVSVHDIAFHLTPLELPTRAATHYHATVKSAVLPGDQRVRDMNLELLRTGASYLVLNLEATRQTGTGALPPDAPPDAGPDNITRQHIRSELEGALRDDR